MLIIALGTINVLIRHLTARLL